MFEFFGWACINIITTGDDYQEDKEAENTFFRGLKRQIERIPRQGIVKIHLDRRIHEDLHALSVAVLTNHRREDIIDLFRWLAPNAPQAYGLLYVRDDEDCSRERNYENVFRVWRLQDGELEEMNDPFFREGLLN